MVLVVGGMKRLLLAIALVTAAATTPAAAPGLGAMIASATDTSPGALDARARSAHGAVVRRALRRELAAVKLDGARLDVSVVRWRIAPGPGATEVGVELRVVVNDARGRMRAILTGRARISAPAATPLPELRAQAIAEAIHGLRDGLHLQLARAVA